MSSWMAIRSRVTPKTALVGRPSGAVICGIAWNIWKMSACVSSRYRLDGESDMLIDVPNGQMGKHPGDRLASCAGFAGQRIDGHPSGGSIEFWGSRVRPAGRVATIQIPRRVFVGILRQVKRTGVGCQARAGNGEKALRKPRPVN